MKYVSSSFKLSALALLISATFPNQAAAQTQGVPECELATSEALPSMFGLRFSMGYRNPHCVINHTAEVAKYSGEGVKLGVVDNGFILDHQNLAGLTNIVPLTFKLHNPLANREDTFDGATDFVGDTAGQWRRHGAGSIAPIVAKPSERGEGKTPYAGGIAPNSTVYITSMLPNNRETAQLGKGYVQGDDQNLYSATPVGEASDYHVASYAGGIRRLLQEKPLAINMSANIKPTYKTEAEIDAKYRDSIQQYADHSLVSAMKAAAAQDTLMVISTGNENNPQPGIYTLLPRYFNGLDKHMVAVTALPIALDPLLSIFGNVSGADPDFANKCGVAKAWCITAPGSFPGLGMSGAPTARNSTFIDDTGTSIAAPVTTAALGVLKQRFNYMTATQVRDTLFTTATDLGARGVDEVYGWGLIDLARGIKGPMQLLNDESYQVTQDDRWDNPLNANGNRLEKQGSQRLTLAGQNQLGDVSVQAGTLNFSGETRADTIHNRATLEIQNRLSGQIRGTMQSDTKFGANSHWVMPQSTTLGNVEMEKGAQITLNPANAKAGGTLSDSTAFNTLTINNNLSGNGMFNFVTRLKDWRGDRILVNGIASGDFQLNVQNSGAEPSDVNRLTLIALRHGAQDEHNVNVRLVNPVDLGTYRYELIKEDNNEYRLYNPRKEEALVQALEEEARLAEEEAQRQAEALEAERAEQARRLAEAERLSAERQTALEAEKLAKENAQRELAEARRTLASQAEAISRAEEAQKSAQQLNETIQAQLDAEREANTQAQIAAEALKASLSAQEAATQAANDAKAAAERAKVAADSARAEALQQAQAALTQAEEKAREAQQATARATEAEQQARQAQAELESANQQLATQQSAVALAEAAQQRAELALEKQTAALNAVQRAREEADNALQTANSEKAEALKQAESATRLAEQKIAEAQQAHQLSAETSTELARIRRELEQARGAQSQAERERDALQRQQEAAEAVQNRLREQQTATQAELANVRQSLDDTRQQLVQKAAEAEQARLAAEKAQADKAAADELARLAEIAKNNALSGKTAAENLARAAEQQMLEAQAAKHLAEQNARLANEKAALAEREKAQSALAQAEADLAKRHAEQTALALTEAQQRAENARIEAENAHAQTTALLAQEREARQQLEQAKSELENAQNGTEADLSQARLALRQVESELAAQNAALAAARFAQQNAENEKAEALLAVEKLQTSLAQATLAQAEAHSAQLRAEEQALNAAVALAQAEADKQQAEQAQQTAETMLAQARLTQAKAEAESAEAQAKLAQAELLRAQTETDNMQISRANRALAQAQAELETALNAERQAREQLEQENARLSASQNTTGNDLAKARLALEESERQLAEKTRESETAQQNAEAARLAAAQAVAQQALAQENARLAELARAQAESEKATAQADALAAEQARAQAQADKVRAEENAKAAEQARLQAEADKARAEAQTQFAESLADSARTAAEQAQTQAQQAQAEAERTQQVLQSALENAEKAKAEVEQALGLSESELAQAQSALEAAEVTLAQTQQQLVEKALEAEQASARAQEAELARQNAEVAQAQVNEEQRIVDETVETVTENPTRQPVSLVTTDSAPRQQAEVISRYANSALSEISAQINALEQMSYGLNQRLFEQPQALTISVEYQTQRLNQASEHYRRYQQDSDLTQLAVSFPLEEGGSVGIVLSDVGSRADFDKQASYRNKSQVLSGFVKMKLAEKVFGEVDLGFGSSHSQIHLDGERNEFDRDIVSAGARIGYAAEVLGVKLQPSVGLRYHHLGEARYHLNQAEVSDNRIDAAGLQAGLRIEKSWAFGKATITPHFAGYYSDMRGQKHSIQVNGNPLTQSFSRQLRHEIGLSGQFANWQLNAKAGVISSNDAERQRYAGVKLNYHW